MAGTARVRATRSPWSSPARSSAPTTSSPPAGTGIGTKATSAPRAVMSPLPSSRANRNRPGSPARAGRAQRAWSSSRTSGATSIRPRPSSPAIGEARMLRTRSWVAEGSSPAAAMPEANAASPSASSPRTCTLARDVSSITPEPRAVAAAPSSRSWAAVRMPPGTRIRATAPSAAGCVCNAPGQASGRDLPGWVLARGERPGRSATATFRMLTLLVAISRTP